jgi:hypothetical protein
MASHRQVTLYIRDHGSHLNDRVSECAGCGAKLIAPPPAFPVVTKINYAAVAQALGVLDRKTLPGFAPSRFDQSAMICGSDRLAAR